VSARAWPRRPATTWCSDCASLQSPEKAVQRLAHDLAQAHRLIQALDAEKVSLGAANYPPQCTALLIAVN
jgi:hypothetical protein